MSTAASLSPDDRPFRHYSVKHRVTAWISRNLFDHITYTVRHGLLKGMKRRGGLAWLPEFIAGSARTPEHEFWSKQDFTGQTVYDIGAFHGLLTLYFARRCQQVVSYEPNSRNHRRLLENLELNGLTNVQVRKVGVGASAAVATMAASAATPGGASVEPNAVAALRASGDGETEQITIVRLDDDVREQALPAPDFIKIDIEGEELAALQGARETLERYKPRLFIELHGYTMNQKRRNVAAVVAYLEEAGYREIRHVESGARISSENSALAAQGHLYCAG
jgi:FkbM family methyltransferase